MKRKTKKPQTDKMKLMSMSQLRPLMPMLLLLLMFRPQLIEHPSHPKEKMASLLLLISLLAVHLVLPLLFYLAQSMLSLRHLLNKSLLNQHKSLHLALM